MLTVEDVERRVSQIKDTLPDHEKAHGLEDKLYLEVLDCIRDGHTPSPRLLADAALKTQELGINRWYA